ncbi:MAG: STAS/SEC14 domain-containing protein [Pseudonocardia sp.]|nr:STAS/SEC14 domain-containing protein [Pseudonocardia sp.]
MESDPVDGLVGLDVDPAGFVRLTWLTGLRIDDALAARAMAMVDELNAGKERPLLVDMTGTAQLTRDARMRFGRRCSASRIVLLGRSEVDRVIANFALGVTRVPVPTRFFTSEPQAVRWLCGDDAAP